VGEEAQPAHRINGTLTQEIDNVLRKGLAKKPEDRYPHCSAFVAALEMACAESRGWQTLPAGASAAMPTVSIERAEAAPNLRAVHNLPDFARPESVDFPASTRPWRLATALVGIVAVLGAVGYLAWRSGEFPMNYAAAPPPPAPFAENARPAEPSSAPAPQETNPASHDTAGATSTDATASGAADSTPQTSAPPPDSSASAANSGAAVPDPVAAANQMLGKPSPVVPAASDDIEPRIQEAVRIPPGTPQDVWVTSNPPGAKAVVDGDLSHGCATPCMLQATPGVHHLTVAQDGFQTQ